MRVRVDVGAGIDTFISDLEKYEAYAEEFSKRAIWEGARIVTDDIRKSIQSLNTVDGRVKDYEKEGLLEGLGIATMKNSGDVIDTKIGMDGYNHHPTKKYPKGQPNAMIARSIEKGTSFRRPTPFISTAVERSSQAAVAAMSAEFDRLTAQVMS